MALAVAFDTHKFVRKLKGAGFNDQQAEALTDAVHESHASLDIATKRDIDDLRRDLVDAEERTDAKFDKLETGLRHEIGDLRKDMEAKFAGVDAKLEKAKFDLLKWMVGLAVGNFAFLVGIFWKVMSIPVPGATH